MFKVILAATDGSAHGSRAVEAAAAIARKFEAKLVVITIIKPGPPPRALVEALHREHDQAAASHPLLTRVPSWFDDARDATRDGVGEAHALVEALAREALYEGERAAQKEGVTDCRTITEHGDPADIIVKYAETENADLVVMGRRGLGTIGEILHGSVSHKVMQHSDRNCLTIR